MQSETRGGCSDTDARLLAVMPSGWPSGPLVTMVTPVGEAAEELAEAGGVDLGGLQTSILARKEGLSTARAGRSRR